MLIRSFVNVVLLNRQTGESATPSGSANTKGSTTVPTERERDFRSGERVRNTKTGETGVVASVSPTTHDTTPVIYSIEFDEWGAVWDVPNHRLELIP